MLGGIYTEEDCPQCGTRMVDNHRDAVCCPRHKKEKAHNLIIRFGRKFFKRTTDYQLACRILNGIRFKHDEGTYDPRDYQKSNPLGIEKQIERYLEVKSATLKPGSMRSTESCCKRITNYFGPTNVKDIGYAEIEDFMLSLKGISGKTKFNTLCELKCLYKWMAKRQTIRKDKLPDFPTVEYELGTRKLVSKELQAEIIEDIRKNTNNYRLYIGVLFLSTYINTRPGELVKILESDIDLDRRIIHIRDHKTSKFGPKTIKLIQRDVELLKGIPKGFGNLHFFRNNKGHRVGHHAFYDAWKASCKRLGVEGVDLYGGTRHSSATAVRKYKSFEDTKELTGHETNASFLRYIEQDDDRLREGYEMIREGSNTGAPRVKDIKPAQRKES